MSQRSAVGTGHSQALGVGSDVASYTTWTVADATQWSALASSDDNNLGVITYMAIRETDGALYGWGDNNNNLLLQSTTTDKNAPVLVLAGPVVSVALGWLAAYVVKHDGTLWVWGSNLNYELGLGDTTARTTPTQVGVASNWSKVYAFGSFALAIKTNGTLWSCGSNYAGGTGQGTAVGSTQSWTQIGVATDWVKVGAGEAHALARKANGTLYRWGDSYAVGPTPGTDLLAPTQVGVATDWFDFAVGKDNACAWKANGTAYVVGNNNNGQLGLGSSALTATDFTLLSGISLSNAFLLSWEPATVFVNTAGASFGAGSNFNYVLGLPLVQDYPTRTALSLGTGLVAFTSTGRVSQALVGALLLNQFVTDAAASAESVGLARSSAMSDAISTAESPSPGRTLSVADTAAGADTLDSFILTMYLEAVGLSDTLVGSANTTASLSDSANIINVVQQAISQIVTDSAAGADNLRLGAALALVDIANAVAIQTPIYNSVALVAEMIATLEAYNRGDVYDVAETGALSDAYTARIEYLVAALESAQASDANTVVIHVMQAVSDNADGTTSITSTGSLINTLLTDAVLATVRLNVGGELFTGWVLNADTLAPSEYQFADLNFNSACKHGDRYLMAADDGIYQFTDEVGSEMVMTYIRTGKLDFGSDKHKRVINSYMVYSATGQMRLKVTTSENGQIQTHTYQMDPFASNETTDTRRFAIGKGLKSRYWQFEVIGEGVDCKFDEIGMLPVVLSRRI